MDSLLSEKFWMQIMRVECVLKDYQADDIRRLRQSFTELRGYLDDEIANCYSLYSEMFHAAGWGTFDDAAFVKWDSLYP